VSRADQGSRDNSSSKEIKNFRIGGGLSAEYITLSAQLKQDFTPYGLANFNQSHHMKHNVQLAPFVEFGSFVDERFYLGLVTSWHYSNTKDNSRFYLRGRYSMVTEFKLKSYFSSLLKLGYKVQNNMMLYGVVGPSYAQWSHKTAQYFNETFDGSFDVNKRSAGFAFGGGAEFSMTKNIALSVDYIHTLYRSTKANQVINIKDQDFMGNIIVRSKEVTKTIKPSHGVLSLKLSYFF
tara:strand:- start:571 stop:1278 length:708 start_codon:yes stop_codon:yes gene_type:complete